jgi:hypothetical protein
LIFLEFSLSHLKNNTKFTPKRIAEYRAIKIFKIDKVNNSTIIKIIQNIKHPNKDDQNII